ncbi:EamA family transporter [uncultured Bilophila sp.]|uniref:DMT family transporter n=1 Tax=uncultured Bilophila sp. TaxID=529385 RepID=UPI00280BC47C|nr:EamA family transporter [uncultured Bilophila sp.]
MSTPFAKGPLLIVLGALCFSTTGTVQALAPEGATPYVIGALRLLGGGLALLAWCAIRGDLPRFWRWPMRCVIPSALALFGFQVFFFQGVLDAGVAVGTVIAIGSSPIAVALLGLAFLREKPAKAWYPATGLALLGLLLLNIDSVDGASAAGMAFPLLAGVSYACYFVFSKPLAQDASPESVMMVLFLLSGLCMLPVFWIYPSAWLATPAGALVALHLGIVTTAIAYSLTLTGLRVTPAATASTLSLAEPLSAACLGIFFLHEPLSPLIAVGMALIFGSVLILVACPSDPAADKGLARPRPQGH